MYSNFSGCSCSRLERSDGGSSCTNKSINGSRQTSRTNRTGNRFCKTNTTRRLAYMTDSGKTTLVIVVVVVLVVSNDKIRKFELSDS